jgi:hypothetical protein
VGMLSALKKLRTQFNEGLFSILFCMFLFNKGDKSLARFNDYQLLKEDALMWISVNQVKAYYQNFILYLFNSNINVVQLPIDCILQET